MLPIETTFLYPRRQILLVAIAILFGIFFLIGSRKSIEPGVQYVVLIGIALIGFLWFGLKKIYILIDNNGLTHKTLFSTKELLWSAVIKTYIKYEHHGKSGSHYWFFEATDRPFKFSTSLYSRKSLQLIAEAVMEKCTNATIDDKIKKWAEGRFPWYIF
jgi:hypothetical protein